jgi:hypothetical protein
MQINREKIAQYAGKIFQLALFITTLKIRINQL